MRRELARYGGAEIALREFENGPPVDAPIALRVVGSDLDTLRAVAARMEALFDSTPVELDSAIHSTARSETGMTGVHHPGGGVSAGQASTRLSGAR